MRLGRAASAASLTRGLIGTRLILMAAIGAALGFPQTLPPLSSNATVFASGFNNPRGLKFGPDGVLYAAEGGVVDISESHGHMVPTALAYHNGWYFGNLFQFPVHRGESNIYRLDGNKRIHVVVPQVTTVRGIAFDSQDRMYILEMSAAEGGPAPGVGKVVRYEYNGHLTDIATGLSFPTGMTFGPDGRLYVSNFGFGFPPGSGQVISVKVPD